MGFPRYVSKVGMLITHSDWERVEMLITQNSLDTFVSESDRLGGPGTTPCAEYWAKFTYLPSIQVDQELDPFSDAYLTTQLSLYEEISARKFDQLVNEHTTFDLDRHVNAVNPYDHGSPGGLAIHTERLSRAVRFAAPPRGGRLLDMGCGWGLSSELAAYCGLNVISVDVNPDFVSLVNRRAQRRNWAIKAFEASFDSFNTDDRFDAILFYECFHHALRPWDVLEKMVSLLAPNGSIVFAGEPINNHWWKNWGLRLDPLSIYCIRKFGWFESGWSLPFLSQMFTRAGLNSQIIESKDSEIGTIIVCTPTVRGTRVALELWREGQHSGWDCDIPYLTSLGDCKITLIFPAEARVAQLKITNFRPKKIDIKFQYDGRTLIDQSFETGVHVIGIEREASVMPLQIVGEVWNPSEEVKTADMRDMSFHLEQISFV